MLIRLNYQESRVKLAQPAIKAIENSFQIEKTECCISFLTLPAANLKISQYNFRLQQKIALEVSRTTSKNYCFLQCFCNQIIGFINIVSNYKMFIKTR